MLKKEWIDKVLSTCPECGRKIDLTQILSSCSKCGDHEGNAFNSPLLRNSPFSWGLMIARG